MDTVSPLLSLESIPARIAARLSVLARELPEEDPGLFSAMEVRASTVSREGLTSVEIALGRTLPETFRELTLAYELGGLELGGVLFGDEGSFPEFLLRQIEPDATLASAGSTPPGELVLGGTDGFVVSLDCATGAVLARRRDALPGEEELAAADAAGFFRALATLFTVDAVADEDAFAVQLADAVGGDRTAGFWRARVKGYG